MSRGLIIASSGLAALAVAVLAWRRHRERSASRAFARRLGLELPNCSQRDLLARFSGAALMQIGHSRRIPEAFVSPNGVHLFSYLFETGFEHRRRSHRWLVAAQAVSFDDGRATITHEDWLATTVTGPTSRELPLPKRSHASPSEARQVAIVEDEVAWHDRLQAGLGQWIADQPPERSWEVLPGWVIAYQPGVLQADALAELSQAVEQMAQRLAANVPPSPP